MTFNNSILSGTTLVRERITSEGFVAGSTGWSIDRDGNAEFNDITARGDIESIGTTSTARLNGGSLIIEENADPVTLSRLTISTLEFQDGDTNNKVNLVTVQDATAPKIGFTAPITTTRGVFFDGDTGFLISDAFHALEEYEVWTALPLNNGWVNDAGNPSAQYLLDATGSVYLRGRIKDGTSVNGTVFATLPAGYRPGVIQDAVTTNPATLGTQNVLINTNGQLQIFNVGGANWIGLAGIGPFKVAAVL